MKIVFDTDKNLEYLEIDHSTFSMIDEKFSPVHHILENQIVDIKGIEYHDIIDKTTNKTSRVKFSFPIGTVFCTLYNLSTIEADDLDKLLSAILKKKIKEMKPFELLTVYFLDCFGKEKLSVDLAKANMRSESFDDLSSNLQSSHLINMIPDDFTTLTREDKLLLIRLFNPSFSISNNIQTNTSNFISTFFCIFSYFLLSFCVSYLYYYSTNELNGFQNTEIKIEDIYFIFIEFLEENKVSINTPYDLSYRHPVKEDVKWTLKTQEIFLSITKTYINICSTLSLTLDFSYQYTDSLNKGNTIDKNTTEFACIELLRSKRTNIHFINAIIEGLEKILVIYCTFDVTLVKGNNLLPLMFTFSKRDDPVIYHPVSNYYEDKIQNFSSFLSKLPPVGTNLYWGLLKDVLRNYICYINTFGHNKSSFFNTRPDISPKSQDINTKNPKNFVSLYNDIQLQFLLDLLFSSINVDNYLFDLTDFVFNFYRENFEYFCLLRHYAPMSKFFPNESLVRINCYTMKDLLCASFYGTICYGKLKIKKCHDSDCPCVFLTTKNHDWHCDFHHYLKNKNRKQIKNNHSKIKQKYYNYVRSIDIATKVEKIQIDIDNCLFDINDTDIEKINKSQKIKVIHFLEFIAKSTYSILLKNQYDRMIMNNIDNLIFQNYFNETFDFFKGLTKTKNGRSTLTVLKNRLTYLEQYDWNYYDGAFAFWEGNYDESLYTLYEYDNFQSIEYFYYDIEDYLNFIRDSKNFFINLMIKYYKNITNHSPFKILDSFNLLSKYNNDEYIDLIDWSKQQLFYNGITIVLNELSKLEEKFLEYGNPEYW